MRVGWKTANLLPMKTGITLQHGDWNELGRDAKAIRTQVFVVEQRVSPDDEWDAMDAQCMHFIARDRAGNAVGTARLLPDGHIGRMAVLPSFRGLGVGAALLQAAVSGAAKAGHKQTVLNAQLTAIPFYERHGFTAYGDVFDDAGIDHRAMKRSL